jgi:hypothetical protein
MPLAFFHPRVLWSELDCLQFDDHLKSFFKKISPKVHGLCEARLKHDRLRKYGVLRVHPSHLSSIEITRCKLPGFKEAGAGTMPLGMIVVAVIIGVITIVAVQIDIVAVASAGAFLVEIRPVWLSW